MYNHEFTLICHARGLHCQYPAILKPSFMKGRLENKQSKILQPPVSDKGLSLLYSETDLLAFQQELYQESGLCSDLLGVLFPLCGGEVCFYLEQRWRDVENKHREKILSEWLYKITQWWDVVLGYLSEVPLWSSLATHAANIRSSLSSRCCTCIRLGVPLSSCVSMFVGICVYPYVNHDMRSMPGRKTEVPRKISPMSRKRQQYFWGSCVPHLFIFCSL